MRAAAVRRVEAAGFHRAEGGTAHAGVRPGETVFILTVQGGGFYRLRFGVRVAALERREHGTPTRRASVGRWVRIIGWPFLGTAADAGAVARVAVECAAGGGAAAGSYREDAVSRDPNRCATRAHANATDPRVGAGSGRGRAVRGLPSKAETWGYSPANGRRAGTHSPRKVAAIARRERQREASRRNRLAREDAMRSLGLTKVQAGGKTFWE